MKQTSEERGKLKGKDLDKIDKEVTLMFDEQKHTTAGVKTT